MVASRGRTLRIDHSCHSLGKEAQQSSATQHSSPRLSEARTRPSTASVVEIPVTIN